jgi:hypothetical protein
MPYIMGEFVDQLVTLEMRNRAMNTGVMGKLYRAALAEAGVGVGNGYGQSDRDQLQNS